MEKKLMILIVAILLMVTATGCRKKVHMTSETNGPSTEETMTSIIQENESVELAVDALEERNITEDVSSTTQTPDPAKSASATTGVHKQTETVTIVIEVTEPVETTAPVSEVLPGDNEVHEPTETVPIATEATEPVETTSPVSQVLPGDNWETPDL